MATVNNKRTQITKQLFHQSLLTLLNTKTMNDISIKMICDEAELNRSTFYLHYDSQYDLLKEIQNDVIQKSLNYLYEVKKGGQTILLIQNFLTYVKDNNYIFKILMKDSTSSYFIDEYIKTVQNMIMKNLPVIENEKNTPYLYTFIMQGCFNIIKQWINNDFDLSIEDISQFIYKMCDKCFVNTYIKNQVN